jgi:hypothetical protein
LRQNAATWQITAQCGKLRQNVVYCRKLAIIAGPQQSFNVGINIASPPKKGQIGNELRQIAANCSEMR